MYYIWLQLKDESNAHPLSSSWSVCNNHIYSTSLYTQYINLQILPETKINQLVN